ncbi:unnamed protein product, partial [Larinioides sclopetarius]
MSRSKLVSRRDEIDFLDWRRSRSSFTSSRQIVTISSMVNSGSLRSLMIFQSHTLRNEISCQLNDCRYEHRTIDDRLERQRS